MFCLLLLSSQLVELTHTHPQLLISDYVKRALFVPVIIIVMLKCLHWCAMCIKTSVELLCANRFIKFFTLFRFIRVETVGFISSQL